MKRQKTDPAVSALSQAARQVGGSETKLTIAAIERAPSDVLLQCMQFLTLSDVLTRAMGVKALRRGVGGEQKDQVVVKALRQKVVELGNAYAEAWKTRRKDCLRVVHMFQHHVTQLDVDPASWIEALWNQADVMPMFPVLHTLYLAGSFLLVPRTWNLLLNHCSELVNVNIATQWRNMNRHSDWIPQRPRKHAWRSVVMPGCEVDPSVYVFFANPELSELVFQSSSTARWTIELLQELCGKWQGQGKRLTKLDFGHHLFLHMDGARLVELMLLHFPELTASPWMKGVPYDLSIETVRAMYATWSFMTVLPPQDANMGIRHVTTTDTTVITRTRSPLQEIDCGTEDAFFASWTMADIVALLKASQVWEKVDIRRIFAQPWMDETTLEGLVTPHLRKLIVAPCGHVSARVLHRIAECKSIRTGVCLGVPFGGPTLQCNDVDVKTVRDLLVWKLGDKKLDAFVCCAVTAKDIVDLASSRVVVDTVAIKVTRDTAQALLQLAPPWLMGIGDGNAADAAAYDASVRMKPFSANDVLPAGPLYFRIVCRF